MPEPASVMNPEQQDRMVLREGEPQVDGEPRRRGPMKFAYASGSRPLDGYVIKRGIGAGGFGDVYYATSDAGKEVALKRIQRNLDVELRGVSQCLNLKHPNLVALYDIRYDDTEQAWVVMEYVSGQSLQAVIEEHPQGLPLDQVTFWIQGILRGVAYLHDHGIVHRDLKPGNIFLDQGTVKIGDYGLSKFISCSRRSGQTESVGTFHYMAPEIGLGRYGKEIDVYALGILLYELLTGQVPFEGESSQEIIMKHLTAKPDLDRVPPMYRPVLSRALAKDPADRFGSVAEMLAALGLGDSDRATTADAPVGAANWAGAGRNARDYLGDNGVSGRAYAATTPGRRRDDDSRWANTRGREPIAAAVRMQAQKFRDWWRTLPPWKRLVVGIAVAVLVLENGVWLAGVLFGTAVAYGGYFVIWTLFGNSASAVPPPLPTAAPLRPDAAVMQAAAPTSTPVMQPVMAKLATPTPSRPIPASGPPRPRQISRQQIHDRMRQALGQKPLVRRGSELSGSMLLSAGAVAILSVLMTIVGVQHHGADLQHWAPLYAWIAVTSTVAVWTVLALGKVWESAPADPALRRFMLLVAGMFVGCIAWLLANTLMLEPVYNLGPIRGHSDGLGGNLPALYQANGAPRILAYAGYFGGLFLTLRWWLATDPLRNSRFSIFGLMATGICAVLWYLIIPVPRVLLVAATTNIAGQLSATWIPQEKRDRFRERLIAEQRMLA